MEFLLLGVTAWAGGDILQGSLLKISHRRPLHTDIRLYRLGRVGQVVRVTLLTKRVASKVFTVSRFRLD